jgi:hypothetical protein
VVAKVHEFVRKGFYCGAIFPFRIKTWQLRIASSSETVRKANELVVQKTATREVHNRETSKGKSWLVLASEVTQCSGR